MAAPLAAAVVPAIHSSPTASRQQPRRRPTTARPAAAAAAAASGRPPSPSSPLLLLLGGGGRRLRCEAVAAPPAATSTDTAATTSPRVIAAVAAPSCRLVKDVAVAVQRTSITSRVLVAAVDIAAPPAAVWGALTDYERLADFIPSLETNECLSHDPAAGTARLRQVGAQDVAMGVKFRAAVTLDIREHRGRGGIPPEMVTTSSDSRDYLGKQARFPAPVAAPGEDEDEDGELADAARAMEMGDAADEAVSSSSSSSSSSCSSGDDEQGGGATWPRDISFELVEGDFSAFRGVWRISEGPAGPLTARLSYAVFVQPQAFLPVGLIQGRISRDVATNLKSVRAHAEEEVYERLLRQQTAAAEAAVAAQA